MRLIASSEAGAVESSDAEWLISERLVLANAVCTELDASYGKYADKLPAAGLTLLRRWVGSRYPNDEAEVLASDGLDDMVVPPGAEQRMMELRIATVVCEDLAVFWTADTQRESRSDTNRISESLSGWRESRWSRADLREPPMKGWPMPSLPYPGHPLLPDLDYAKKASAQRQATFWNEAVASDATYGPGSGFVVGVAKETVNRRWSLVWEAR